MTVVENKIIIQSPSQCMDILNSILDNTYPQEKVKYASYVSMNYFVKNLNSFSKDYIEMILSDEVLGLSISAKFSYDLLENAVKNNAIFPAYSKKWFTNVKTNQELLEKYLGLLVNSQDNAQIEDFCHINPVLSKNYYLNNYPENYAFEKSVIANNPATIINKRSLTEEDTIELIEKGLIKYEHMKRVFSKYSYKVQTLVTKNEIELILNYDLTKEDKKDLIDLMLLQPYFFIAKLKETNSNFTRKLLDSPVLEVLENHMQAQPNILQTLLIKNVRREEHLKEVIALSLSEYEDILFKDIPCFVGRMKNEYTTPFLIYAYEKQHYGIFNALSYFNEELKISHKEITLNATFDCLLDNYHDLEEVSPKKFDIDKHIKPLLNFKYADLNEKMLQFKKQGKVELSILEDMEKYFLHNKLSEKLVEKQITEKRLKI